MKSLYGPHSFEILNYLKDDLVFHVYPSIYMRQSGRVFNLDDTPTLIGFDNGVFDLISKRFHRELRLHTSTGYDYVDYSDGDCNGEETGNGEVKEVLDFIEKILPEKDVREYVLATISSFLLGTTDGKCHIWKGENSFDMNELVSAALGDYSVRKTNNALRAKTGGNLNTNYNELHNKRLVSIFDEDEPFLINADLMKTLLTASDVSKKFSNFNLIWFLVVTHYQELTLMMQALGEE